MRKWKAPTDDEIVEMQKYYDTGVSVQIVATKFGWWKGTLLKYLTVRHPKVSDEERRRRRVESVVSWRQRTKQRLVEYKGGHCEICCYNKCISNLTFHHLNPSEKDFQISGTSKKFETLKKEVDKCALLCRDCHGEVHAAYNGDQNQMDTLMALVECYKDYKNLIVPPP